MSSSSEDEIETHDEDVITDDEEEILASEDDDDDYLNDGKFSRFKIELKKDEMASDIEDEDENDFLPNSQAWGKNKKLFYDTDYVDKDFRSQKQREEEEAQYEEQEALATQKRLFESVNEKDLGLDFFIETKPKSKNETQIDDKTKLDLDKSGQIELDFAGLNDDQKLAIIKRESPELEFLISDSKKYLSELIKELEPMLKNLLKCEAISSSGLKYVKLRYLVLFNYCTNISFYLSLMCSKDRGNVKEHPIIKEIFLHKKLISELDACIDKKGKRFLEELDFLSRNLQQNKKIKFIENSAVFEEGDNLLTAPIDSKIKTTKMDVNDIQESGNGDNIGSDDDDEKRAITYEMEKNKGLIPKRKREQRNPRVKYRKKFEKAIIRRKGQVREPRKEIKKYGGEHTGINVRTIKSVKFR